MLKIIFFIAILNLIVNAIKHIIGMFQVTNMEFPMWLKTLNTIEALSVAWLTYLLVANYSLILNLII